MKKVKELFKRGFALFGALLMLAGLASASGTVVSTAVPLGNIKDTASARAAVQAQAAAMASLGMLESVGDARSLGVYVESALARSASEWVDGAELTVNAARVNQLAANMDSAWFQDFLNNQMTDRGWDTFGDGSMDITAEFQMAESDIVVTIEPDVVYVSPVNKILISTAMYELSFRPFDLEGDLFQPLVIAIRDISDTFAPRFQITMCDGDGNRISDNPDEKNLAGYFTFSLPGGEEMAESSLIVREESAEELVNIYNDVTQQAGAKVRSSGTYSVGTTVSNGKRFSDLDGLSKSRRDAIERLASRGIIGGYKDGTFHPEGSVNRGQFVKIIMNAIGKINNAVYPQYSDINSSMYYYHHAATAQKLKYMEGYDDGKFHGERTLNKSQICAIMGRILMKEKKYKVSSPMKQLGKYDDTIPGYAQESVALLTQLEILNPSGRYFGGQNPVSRGEIVEMVSSMLRYL